MAENRTAADISEQLFKAIDAIVMERIRVLTYDKTVTATIIENKNAPYGKYKVTTDDNITFYAYADTSKYQLYDKVYVRIPQNDYTKQKIITGRYISDSNDVTLSDYNTKTTTTNKEIVQTLLKALNKDAGNFQAYTAENAEKDKFKNYLIQILNSINE